LATSASSSAKKRSSAESAESRARWTVSEAVRGEGGAPPAPRSPLAALIRSLSAR
jgi:hypothetical protein